MWNNSEQGPLKIKTKSLPGWSAIILSNTRPIFYQVIEYLLLEDHMTCMYWYRWCKLSGHCIDILQNETNSL